MTDRLPSRSDSLIRLGTPLEQLTVSHHNGPGLRIIFWVQGCSLLCTRNCLNPRLLKHDGGYSIPAGALTEALIRLAHDYREIEGITVLGGEPFDQAGALAECLIPVREKNLSIMVYTGHTLEYLRTTKDPAYGQLLDLCDILVDGPFIDHLFDESLIWRGSLNQRLLLLSNRYRPSDIQKALETQQRALAFSVGVRGDAAVSGAQSLAVARRLTQLAGAARTELKPD